MVWGCFCSRGKPRLVFIDGNLNAVKYTELLADVLLPFIADNYRNGCRFQQDNAKPHTAVHTKEWFMEEGVTVIDWPARSPDLNPMENLWSILCNDVYAHNAQYHSTDDLMEAIEAAWERVPLEILKKLCDSMVDRIAAVIDKRGGPTKY